MKNDRLSHREFSDFSNDELDALWQFRCGLVHSSTLYNVRKDKVFRFAYGWRGVAVRPIVKMPNNHMDVLRGRKYEANCDSLYAMFLLAKSSVFEDMIEDFPKYVTNPNFEAWVQRVWTMQYLPDKEEFDNIRQVDGNPTISLEEFERRQLDQKLSLEDKEITWHEIEIVLAQVPFTYTLKLELLRIKKDLRSRIRDLFAP